MYIDHHVVLTVSHILQDYFTDTGAIIWLPIWLPQYLWSNPEEYGVNKSCESTSNYIVNKTKQNKAQYNCVHILWDIFLYTESLYKHNDSTLTPKHRETHGCVVSTVATDALVLKHQAISIHNAD